MIFEKKLTDKRLLAVLSSGGFSSVRLTHSVYGQWPPIPILPPLIAKRLAKHSAPTLTALHDLPLVENWWSRDEPRPGDPGLKLAALTQLRALTLRQTWHGPAELRAKELPPSLEDLTLVMDRAGHVAAAWEPPRLVAFDRLRNLRRITFVEYRSWSIWRRRESRRQPTPLPHSLEVCAPAASWQPLATLPILPCTTTSRDADCMPASLHQMTIGTHLGSCWRWLAS